MAKQLHKEEEGDFKGQTFGMEQSNTKADDDVWDDSLLIKAYYESVKIAKEQLAKRIAESTNTLKENKQADNCSKGSVENVFKVGDHVRATYDDGIDYEAKILSINKSQGTCVLKYVGYENEQEVELSQLIPSWGKKARRMQFIQSKQDPGNAKENLSKGKKCKVRQSEIAELPFNAVPPPPPMPPMLNELTEDSEHLSAMLMSWYMSGYYTGLYHGRQLCRSKGKAKK